MTEADRKQRLYSTTRRVLQRLIDGPATTRQLAEMLHVSRDAVYDTIEWLRSEELVHIGDWQRSRSGYAARVWHAGRGKDAPPIAKLSNAEKSARWRNAGGDEHRARRIKADAKKIARSMTLAGQLGV
jgi:predicted ArsR family transcriptional regulator